MRLRLSAMEAFTDRILPRPIVLSQSAVDDHNQRRISVIGQGEVTPANDRNPLRLKVIAQSPAVSTPDSDPLLWAEHIRPE